MGHKLSGFFSVKGAKKMEMIYCNFFANQNGTTCAILACYCLSNSFCWFLFTDKQKWIGYADVKSAPVHFYVQRNSNFNKTSIPIPFDVAVVNEGNAMNLTSGKFTAPRPGIYFFSFAGTARLSAEPSSADTLASFFSYLYLNWKVIGKSFVREDNTPVNQWSPMSFQLTLNLKKGDQVWMQITISGSTKTSLYDDYYPYTHFTGFLLEEEIVASL
jgi:hypothetical protein